MTAPTSPAAVEINGLSYRYEDGTEALRALRFRVAPGERVGLIGPNGAGKSTLLLHLNGLLPETPARDPAVRIFGTPLTEPNLAAIRMQVGVLFQNPDDQLFCPTVWEDVAFGPRQLGITGNALQERVALALHAVGLDTYGERLPHHLSRGEKRRVCLAGLLSCDARLLVLDEPTSDLDPRGRRELKALLLGLPVTQIIATHDLELAAELCTRVIVMDQGAIVGEGPTTDILNDEPLMLAHGLERPHLLRHHLLRHHHPH